MRDFMCKFGATLAVVGIAASALFGLALLCYIIGLAGCFLALGLGIFPAITECNVVGSPAVSVNYMLAGALAIMATMSLGAIGAMLYVIFEGPWNAVYRGCRGHWSERKGS